MTNYLNQHKSSAPINTPGHLLANVPGALGFYPTDSVIFMTFEPCPQGMAMGPVARIDFDDAQEALPEIWETIVSPQTEGVFAFFITERPMDEVEALAEWMYALHKHTHGMDIDAAWHTTEIVTGARYEILFGVVNHEGNGPMKKWREGPIPALTDAPTMQHCVGKELIPELSREELYQKFAKKLLSKYWGQYTQLGDTFLENLQGLTTAKIYKADGFKHKQMNEEAEHF